MATNYIKKINNLPIAASQAAPGSELAQRLSTLESGSFAVVPLRSTDPKVPDPAGASPAVDLSNKIIYLTKDSSATGEDKYKEWIYTGSTTTLDNTKWEVIGTTSLDLSNYKTKQTAYTATGLGTLKTITALSQNANGEISATAGDIQSASTSQKGVVQLTGSIGATVATENNKATSEKAVRDAINALDVPSTGTGAITGFGAGKTLATLTETDGKVAATFQDISITKSQVSDFPTEMTPASHTHGNITNDGKVGTAANYSVVTTTGGAVTAKSLATSAPTASGDTLAFIDSVSQASDGKITATKKTVSTMGGADGSAAGTAGLVPAPEATDNTKYLRGDGTWATLPSVNNGALKLQINSGTATSKFTANQSGDSTITFATGTTNGTIKVDGTEVAVAGLGSAAYTASTAYATSAQGTKADSAIQGVKVNNTALTPDSSKVVNIPLAATNSSGSAGDAGVVTLEIISI